jgi:LAS superfamily LD-carboxypeptidase LdcB
MKKSVPKIDIPYLNETLLFFKKMRLIYVITIILFLSIVGTIGFGFWYVFKNMTYLSSQITSISTYMESLETNLASTTSQLQMGIEETQSSLTGALDQEKQNVAAIKQQVGNFQQEVGEISGTVGTLEKLSKTDPELLQKYSKVFFLNEHYTPPRVVEIPDVYEYSEDKFSKIHERVWPYLQLMLDSAKGDNLEIYVFSAFRPFSEQQALKKQYTVIYGAGTANQFSADQGYSEHQLGTTVDLITIGLSGQLDGFDNTDAYQWLLKNAYKYGFTLSYPADNGFYVFEPWHWRFIGVKLATDLQNTGKHFYDLDQRKIDEYLVNIFE